ncbi:hypothetical protein BG000_010735 [Podila horticola]|nr:hypothetical protein BG000_010735 [Podila horticola]
MDTSFHSQIGLVCIESVLRRTRLEHLIVRCKPIDSRQFGHIVQLLGSVQCDTLKSLVLSGDSINEWLKLWPTAFTPQLLSLVMNGIGSPPQELSHANVVFVHYLVFASLLLELKFVNIQLEYVQDWQLIVDSLDLRSMETLNLCNSSACQLLSVMDSMDAFNSRTPFREEEGESETQFTLNLVPRSQLEILNVQQVLRRSSLGNVQIVCTSFDSSLSTSHAKILRSLQWTTAKSLVFVGDSINEWIQLLPAAAGRRLESLSFYGSGSFPLLLTHSSAMFISRTHRKSLLRELNFDNVLMQNKHDWGHIVEYMDLKKLTTDLGMCETSQNQLMSTAPAVELLFSKLEGRPAQKMKKTRKKEKKRAVRTIQALRQYVKVDGAMA